MLWLFLLFAINMAISSEASTTFEVCCRNVPLLTILACFKDCLFVSKNALGLAARAGCIVFKWRSKRVGRMPSLLRVLEHIMHWGTSVSPFWRETNPNQIYSSRFFRFFALIANDLV